MNSGTNIARSLSAGSEIEQEYPPLKISRGDKKYDFKLPNKLQCAKPAEERGIRRDEVRLMVSNRETDEARHTIFKNLEDYLREGDVLVVNTSGTLKAALEAYRTDGSLIRIHFSTKIMENQWIVELRKIEGDQIKRFESGEAGETLALKNGGSLELLSLYYGRQRQGRLKLWISRVNLPVPLEEYLDYYGRPIRYSYVKESYPQSYYQTVFAREMGSAEMPSAGRAFTPELIAGLLTKGVQIVPLLLHTGVASLEADERPYEEYYRISAGTADIVNLARKQGRRIIAVGTTVVRALEGAANGEGLVQPGAGWTNVFITPQRGILIADGLLTGLHEPKASHLLMLEALSGRRHLEIAYQEALKREYQWHEFGDLHLILPD